MGRHVWICCFTDAITCRKWQRLVRMKVIRLYVFPDGAGLFYFGFLCFAAVYDGAVYAFVRSFDVVANRLCACSVRWTAKCLKFA